MVSSFSKLPDALELNDLPLGTCLWGSEAKKVTPMVTSMCIHASSISRFRLFATLWTVAHQAPQSMGFFRQEYWKCSGHALLQEIVLTQGSNPHLLCLLHCRQIVYPPSHWGSPQSPPSFLQKRILHTLDQ